MLELNRTAFPIPMLEQTFKNVDEILHEDAGCTSELDYTEQSSWLLFLKYLDALERVKAAKAALEGKRYTSVEVAELSGMRRERCEPTSDTCSRRPMRAGWRA